MTMIKCSQCGHGINAHSLTLKDVASMTGSAPVTCALNECGCVHPPEKIAAEHAHRDVEKWLRVKNKMSSIVDLTLRPMRGDPVMIGTTSMYMNRTVTCDCEHEQCWRDSAIGDHILDCACESAPTIAVVIEPGSINDHDLVDHVLDDDEATAFVQALVDKARHIGLTIN